MTGERRPSLIPAGRTPRSDCMVHRLQAGHPYPLTVVFTVTERCNLRCAHCYVVDDGRQDELSLSEIEVLLDELAGLGTLFLTVTGGEPALRQDLEAIVTAAVDRRFSVLLKTSATLLDAERVDALVAAGLREVHVSLYDDRPAEHDAFVGKAGAWQRSMDAMERFAARGVNVRASLVAYRSNVERIPLLVTLCGERGFDYSVSTRMFPGVDGGRGPCALRIDGEQVERLLADPRLFSPADLVAHGFPRPEGAFCAAGVGVGHVWPDGRVGLCPIVPTVLGNVRERTFAELWRESVSRREFTELTWSKVPECRQCAEAWACNRCPGAALLETGDLAGISPADCTIARARARVCERSTRGQE